MSFSLIAFPPLSAVSALGGVPIFNQELGAALTPSQSGGMRFTILSSASTVLTALITPDGGTLASGTLNDAVALTAGAWHAFILDVPRGATFDLQTAGASTVSIFAAHVVGAVS